MKMLKRFLPIATIGCTALAIAPFVTSCSKKNGVDIQKIIKGEYKRQTDLAGPGTKSEAEITDFYVSAIKENKQIFVDDIYIAMSELLNELLVEEEELDPNAFSGTASISLDNIKQDITYGYRISSN
ncbi:MAG: hypothetical protein MJ219_02845 [Mycoplasmoidaceae bacterium]|nr:hypothetical protein [Mycoplasmoidaceae bacterium]